MFEKMVNTAIFAELQMFSVAKGNCQTQEDAPLTGVAWKTNRCEFIRIPVFASSSDNGQFALMGICNALFMTHYPWHELGGYDERF